MGLVILILIIILCQSLSTAQGMKHSIYLYDNSHLEIDFGVCIVSTVQSLFPSVIVTPPGDRTVFLDDDAVFSCLTDVDYTAHWRLNETDYDDLPSQLQHDLVISSESTTLFGVFSITISARAEYNGTRVQCVAESDYGYSVVSDNATIRIQGMPNQNT